MAETGPFLTEEMRSRAIGVESPPQVLEVEKGAIVRFAQAIGDPNPLWNDEAEARQSAAGGMVAPPTFLRSAPVIRPDPPFPMPFERMLDAGSDWEYFEPVRPGDTITTVARIESMSERSGRLGLMVFTVLKITYTNQFGRVVATQLSTLIRY